MGTVAERAYGFRSRLEEVHEAGRRDPSAHPEPGEAVVGEGWTIVVGGEAPALVLAAARDLQDYLLVSMAEPVLLRPVADPAGPVESGERVIVLGTQDDLSDFGAQLGVSGSHRLRVTPSAVVVCGKDARGAAQGCYHLEDLMNLREAPFLKSGDGVREPLFSPRMVHSGWGLDEFPDPHLSAMAHAGIDAILVFVQGVDRTPDERHRHEVAGQAPGSGRYQDLRALVRRAARYGLDVYLYSYLQSLEHPDSPDAEAHYEQTYGALFESCPDARGLILVGESVEFPSRDPRTTGRLRLAPSPDGLPPDKPSPGWWPCVDYPEWLEMVARTVRRHSPGADIVFWTYNWGFQPEEDRLALIRSLPPDVSLLVTFEMFEPRRHDGVTNICVDYTASFVGPGRYFASEAQAAKERGLRLYTMSNTGGLTWDFGVIPYEPVPYQWGERHVHLLEAHERWGLSGLMESHHYGWWPSVVSEIAKSAFWVPTVPPDELYAGLARRDYGAEGAGFALECWRHWSRAIKDYVPTNEDQYGPFRIGPSYPLVFLRPVKVPTSGHAMFGDRIFHTDYRPHERAGQSVAAVRFPAEIQSLRRMVDAWKQGIEALEKAVAAAPERKRSKGRELLGLGRFMLHCIVTTIHCKQWWLLKQRLFTEPDPAKAAALMEELRLLAEREIGNAEAAIPLVEEDSRLGWEPTMDYVTDAAHIRWKIKQVRRMIGSELAGYRSSIVLGSEEEGSPVSAGH